MLGANKISTTGLVLLALTVTGIPPTPVKAQSPNPGFERTVRIEGQDFVFTVSQDRVAVRFDEATNPASRAEALEQVELTAGARQVILIDFESFTAMDYVSGQPIPEAARLSMELAATYGVLFSSGAPYVPVIALGVDHAASGINGIGGSTPDGLLTYDAQWPIVFRFVDPANPGLPAATDFVSVRCDLHGSSSREVYLNAYTAGDILIDSDHVFDSGGQTLTVAAPGIHRVEFIGTDDNDGVALDDLTFNPVNPIPTPAESRSWGRVKALYRIAWIATQ